MPFHFDFKLYTCLLRLALAEPRLRPKLRALFVGLVAIPLYSGTTAVFYTLDNLFPALWRAQIEEPVFVVGHARSGTTLLHRLLVSDGEQFNYFLTYELFFPSLLQKRILRGIGRVDEVLFRSFLKKRLLAAEDRALGGVRDMHHTGLFVPEEDDFVLGASCVSGLWVALLPALPEFDVYYVDAWPKARRKKMMKAYANGVRRQLALSGLHKTHCSKNPAFSGRVESLIEQFPDARFVVMVRDPREAIPSLLKMMQTTWRAQGWSESRIERSVQALLANSVHTYLYPLETLRAHPETRSIVVDYRELVAEPKRTVEEVYRALGMTMTTAVADALEDAEARARTHTSDHRYALAEFGIDEAQLKEDLRELFERFGWDDPPPEVSP
ncbi:MAG: sulfotransferase [Myxococcota bacterium]